MPHRLNGIASGKRVTKGRPFRSTVGESFHHQKLLHSEVSIGRAAVAEHRPAGTFLDGDEQLDFDIARNWTLTLDTLIVPITDLNPFRVVLNLYPPKDFLRLAIYPVGEFKHAEFSHP